MRAFLVAICAAAVFARPAVASPTDPTGFTVDVAAGVGRDDNLFRLPDGQPVTDVPNGDGDRGDTVTRLDVGTGIEAEISRQRFGADLAGYAVRYDRYDFLDHEGGLARVFWLWQAGPSWEGNVETTHSRTQSQFANLQTPVSDITTATSVDAGARYHLGPRISLHGSAGTTQERHSAKSREELDRTLRRWSASIDYVSPSTNRLAIERDFSDIAFDERVTFDTGRSDYGYRQTETHLVAELRRNPLHQFDIRVGYTEQDLDDPSKNEFSGFSGSLKYRLNPTDATHLAAKIWRAASPIDDITSSYILAEGARLNLTWKATSVVDLTLSALREWRQFLGQPDTLRADVRTDVVYSYAGTLIYRPSRTTSVEFSANHGLRNSTLNDRDYDFNELWITARLEL